VQKGSRLSVMPVTAEQWAVCSIALRTLRSVLPKNSLGPHLTIKRVKRSNSQTGRHSRRMPHVDAQPFFAPVRSWCCSPPRVASVTGSRSRPVARRLSMGNGRLEATEVQIASKIPGAWPSAGR
jgi:hypothetical protein